MVNKLKIRPQELAKAKTEFKILRILTDKKKRVRWKVLLEEMNVSSRTLADRLKELRKKGAVRRIVDTSVYPPAVYYEASSSAYLTKLSPMTALSEVEEMLHRWLQTRRIIETGESDPEKLIERLFLDYVWDLLFTLNYCLEDVEAHGKHSTWPFLVYYHSKAYESRIMELIRVASKSAKLREAIKTSYQNFKKEREEEEKRLTEQLIVPFKDKELAKPMIRQYCVMLVEGLVKNQSDFVRQLSENAQLKQKIEKEYGQPIDDGQLQTFMSDPGWNAHSIEKKNVIEAIEQATEATVKSPTS